MIQAPARPAQQHADSAWLNRVAGLALLLALAVALRTFIQRDAFSDGDEIYQLAFVNEPLKTFLALFLRLDQHPPLHFLQLKLWSLVSDQDGWMLANSLVWHGLSCLAIWAVGRAWLGQSAGLLAAALYALLPQVVVSATTLRFYAMLPALAVLTWWLHMRLLSPQPQTRRLWWALVLVQVALAYTHAIAFYFVFWLALAAGLQQSMVVGRAAPWRRWLLVQSGVLLLVLPQVLLTVARALIARSAGDAAGGNHDPGSLIDHFGGMTAGWGMQWTWARAAGAIFFAMALALGLWRPVTRWMSIGLLVGPYALAMLIGLLVTPMYKTPLYSAMLVPFCCLAMAAGLMAWPVTWRLPAVVVLVVAMLAFLLPASVHLNRGVSSDRPIVAELQRLARPGDVVLVPNAPVYWRVMRYAVAPNWGSPLAVLPALQGSWLRMTERLGPRLSQFLQLVPATQQIQHAGITYVVGADARGPAAAAARVWVVEVAADERTALQLAPGLNDRGVVFRAGSPLLTQIRLYAR